jgi:anti-anti-sigma regulatory factor
MLTLDTEHFGGMAVIECYGRIVQSDDAHRLRSAVIAVAESRIIVLDLSEIEAVEGAGLGVLAYLQLWAFAHDVKLKLFNPSDTVLERIDRASLHPCQIATLDEMTALLMVAEQFRCSKEVPRDVTTARSEVTSGTSLQSTSSRQIRLRDSRVLETL